MNWKKKIWNIIYDNEEKMLVEELIQDIASRTETVELCVNLMNGKPQSIYDWAPKFGPSDDEYPNQSLAVPWRADHPETFYRIKGELWGESYPNNFYDKNVIEEILNETVKLNKVFKLRTGRMDFFVVKKDGKFHWYINEVQNHGLTPRLVSPDLEKFPMQNIRKCFPVMGFSTREGGRKQAYMTFSDLKNHAKEYCNTYSCQPNEQRCFESEIGDVHCVNVFAKVLENKCSNHAAVNASSSTEPWIMALTACMIIMLI